MAPGAVIVARGRSQGSDILVAADEALAALQRACGGEIPGTIAIPALLELTRKAWRHATPLSRTIHAQDGENAVAAWVEVTPGADGCAMALSNWRVNRLAEPVGDGSVEDALAEDHAVLAQVADLHARLDARQGVLAIGRASDRVATLAQAMRQGLGRPWTDFVTLPGTAHRQPLHWRLLDGATVEAEGVAGRWRARILPTPGEDETAGFDLYLVPTAIDALPEPDGPVDAARVPEALDGILGRDLAPALRQPINRIIANAETIRTRLAGPLADEYASYASDIAEAGRHLLGLVEDLADLEAIEAPGFAPAPDRIDLADAARRAAGILAVRAQDRSIVVEIPASDENVPAVGEFRRVLQVLLNLLGNALRYSPTHSTVRLSVDARGDRASVTVVDEGDGLTREEQAKVFDKFERLGRTGDGGSGLGLYISRRLARAMGGELSVASSPGKGARFTLDLPAG